MEVEKANNFEITNIEKGIIVPDTYNENLDNDPLLNSENEYLILNEKFIQEYCSKLEYTKIELSKGNFNTDFNFKDWEATQRKEVCNSFLKLVEELNQKNIFFFGCSFDNYKHNYERRLKAFLEYYFDTSEDDFIEIELKFLETVLDDLKNSDDYPDDFYQPQIPNFDKVYELIPMIGKQFHYSHIKKINFLEERQDISANNIEKHEVSNVYEGVDIKLAIENSLVEFIEDINGDGYKKLVDALFEYFTNGVFPKLTDKIKFKKTNKKRVGWALKELHKKLSLGKISFEYLLFAKENINLFENAKLEKVDLLNCNLYKYFTTNPGKKGYN